MSPKALLTTLCQCGCRKRTSRPSTLHYLRYLSRYFRKTHQYPPAATEASLAYQRLLRIVRASLQSLISGNIDVCLLTIFFMGRYEDAMHDSCKLDTKTTLVARFRSFSHHDGALAVLKIWKDHLSHNHPATETIKYIRRGLIRSALMRNNAVAEWMIDGAYFSERDLDLEYDRIVVQITIVRQRLAILILMQSRSPCGSHELLSKVEGLNYEIRNIDNALQDWTCRFPRVWSRRQHTLSKDFHWTTQDFYSPIVYSYLNLSNAAVWNKYYVTRMLAISVRLRVLELYHQDLDGPAHGQRLECISHMKAMSDSLSSTIPFCLQRFNIINSPNLPTQEASIITNTSEDIKPYVASHLIWPLTVASRLRHVETKQKLWFRSKLTYLGRIIGSGVLQCAESDQWLEF